MISVKHISAVLLLFLYGLQLSSALPETAIVGTWLNHRGNGVIEISNQDGEFQGVIVGGKTGKPRKDIHNPDPKLRNRPLKGIQVIGGLKYEGQDSWEHGWLYDPKDGETYQCNITLKNSDTLEIRVFKGHPLFGKTVIWTRDVT